MIVMHAVKGSVIEMHSLKGSGLKAWHAVAWIRNFDSECMQESVIPDIGLRKDRCKAWYIACGSEISS